MKCEKLSYIAKAKS